MATGILAEFDQRTGCACYCAGNDPLRAKRDRPGTMHELKRVLGGCRLKADELASLSARLYVIAASPQPAGRARARSSQHAANDDYQT